MVLKRVRGIVTSRDNASVPASVRFDTSSHKGHRVLLHDVSLPRLEYDRALVFSTGAVLWEQNRPSVGIGVDDHDDTAPAKSDRVTGAERGDGIGDSLDDSLLTLV